MKYASGGGWSEPDSGPAAATAPPPVEDHYERIDLVGVGGMGRVFEAFDRALGRRVALKEVAPHLDRADAADRLAQEARLTAELEHPGIVTVHDAGRTGDGRLFYTMRLVRGRSLSAHLDGPLDERGRRALLRHLLDACNAVAYAHARGIVHRDIKPDNVMIGEFGETQVVDWGLARRLSDGPVRGAAGTEGFMAPEAEAGAAVDARSDVWSLGATLRAVMGPSAPSDLVAIADRAVSADPDGRYADAGGLARDLARYLDGRRVEAHTYTPVELLARFVEAWRAPLLVAALAAVALTATGVGAWVRTARARDRAQAAEAEARAALVRSDGHLARSLEAQAAAAVRDGRLPSAEVLATHALALSDSPLARGVLMAGGARPRPPHVELAPLNACEGVVLGADGVLCIDAAGLEVRPTGGRAWRVEGPVSDAIFAGEHVAFARPDRSLELRRLADGAPTAAFTELPGSRRLQASADGRVVGLANGRIATTVSVADGTRRDVTVCGAEGGATAMALDGARALVSCRLQGVVAVEADGRVRPLAGPSTLEQEPRVLATAQGALLGGTVDGDLLVIDGSTGAVRSVDRVLDGPIDRLAPVPGSTWVAVSGDRGGVRLWDTTARAEVLRLPAPTRAVRASPGALHVAGRDLRTWTLPGDARPHVLRAPAGIAALALSPDGAQVAAARGDGGVSVWAVATGTRLAELRWQERVTKWVAYTPSGDRLLAIGLGEPTVRAWDPTTWAPAERYEGGPFRRVGALADGRVWGLRYSPGVALDIRTGLDPWPLDTAPYDAAATEDGALAVFIDERGRFFRLRSGEAEPQEWLTRLGTRGLAVAADGSAALASEAAVELVDPEGRTTAVLGVESGTITDVAVSPDGRRVAAGLLDGRVLVWDAHRPRPRAVLVGHEARVSAVAFSADGAWLATADWNGVVRRWRVAELDRPADDLRAEVARAWHMSLEDALTVVR